jgi:hypothetical protein
MYIVGKKIQISEIAALLATIPVNGGAGVYIRQEMFIALSVHQFECLASSLFAGIGLGPFRGVAGAACEQYGQDENQRRVRAFSGRQPHIELMFAMLA